MPRLLTSAQMREADRRTIDELGLPGVVLMENAGAGVVDRLRQVVPDLEGRRVLILAGRGNNGGDGFVIARRLMGMGISTRVALLGDPESLAGDARLNHGVFVRLGGRVESLTGAGLADRLASRIAHAGVIVDAVFGTGLTKPVTGELAALFQRINDSGKPTLAVDLPSGVSSDDGQVLGTALRARWTVTFGAEKIGHRQSPGAGYCGEVFRVDIGIPPVYLEDPAHRVGLNLPEDLILPPRPADGHKGSFGHALILGGSLGKAGAMVLAAWGAQRAGVGLLTAALPRAAQAQAAARLTEAMTLPLPEDASGQVDLGALDALLASGLAPSALALGPGLGTGEGAAALLDGVLGQWPEIPTVVDADGLNLLARRGPSFLAETSRGRSAPWLLTPHPGEMARLTGRSTAAIQGDRLNTAMDAAQAWGAWVVLKGAGTVIAAPDGRGWINPTGNDGLASGGSGDLLTGILTGLLAQGWSAESAVRAGVYVHGAAADALAREGGAGLLAGDLLEEVRKGLNRIRHPEGKGDIVVPVQFL
ncbi:MAG: NAD(P)H-hydrate dehydratase [Magnetococcales bacterium]|nr:NAD(P)H-hydrate dehydratase [Magnetococcales bacterium]